MYSLLAGLIMILPVDFETNSHLRRRTAKILSNEMKKVQIGNGQEMAQSERNFDSINGRVGKKLK